MRRKTLSVKIGNLSIGSDHSIKTQSMTTASTMDTVKSVEEAIRIIEAGGKLVRFTAPNINEAKNLLNIKKSLLEKGYNTPLVADIHFTPNAALEASTIVEKVRINPVSEVIKEIKQLYNLGVRGFWFTDAQFIPSRGHIQNAKDILQAIYDEGLHDIHWAAYIRADNLDEELAELMVRTGMSYFEIGITSGSQELVRKMRMGYNLKTVLKNCELLAKAGFKAQVSVNYSFNVIDERPETIRQTVAYHRELEKIFGADIVEPSIFFIGLQPHTLLEEYGLEKGLLKPGYNPMSLMPWTARKLLWNPEPMGKEFGRVCLEAFDTNPSDFGRTVMNLLERDYGISSLNDALTVEVKNRPVLAKSLR